MKGLSYGPGDITPASYYGFSFGTAVFSENKEVKTHSGFHTCRESLIGQVSDNLDSLKTDKTHVLLRWDSGAGDEKKQAANALRNQKWIEKSIKLLHIYEKIAGWPLTKPYKIKTENGDSTKLYYFLSSRRWIKAPYLLSLYLLLIRLCKLDHIDGFKTHNDFTKIIEKISIRDHPQITPDERHVIDTFRYWETLITHYADLFRKRKIEYYWSTDRLERDNSVSYEGITNLSKGYTANKALYDKLIEFHKKEGGK
jgi:hypothetical protein